jgi:hypothetical protein
MEIDNGESRMSEKNLNVTVVSPNIGMLTIIGLVILFWDFNEGIDLYDAIIQGLTF